MAQETVSRNAKVRNYIIGATAAGVGIGTLISLASKKPSWVTNIGTGLFGGLILGAIIGNIVVQKQKEIV